MKTNQEIESVVVVNQQGSGNFHRVGENGITSIHIDSRQISSDCIIDVIIVKSGEYVVDEISMSTPYILGFKKQETSK